MNRFRPVLCLLLLLPAVAPASAPDGNVEGSGVSHVAWLDRDPLCPVDGETFTVRFQAYRDDLTSARLNVNDGALSWIDAARTGVRGPYDIWSAQVRPPRRRRLPTSSSWSTAATWTT